jgi:hypothetical protein
VGDGRRKARTARTCGVDKPEAYSELVKEAGISKIYEEPGEKMSLDPTI